MKYWFFDLDGTLADTDRDIREAWKAALGDLGLTCPDFEAKFVAGPPIDDMARTLFPDIFTQKLADDIRAGKFTFEAAAGVLSDDKDTRNNYGLMANDASHSITSRFEMKDLPADVAKVVDTLQVGQVSRAFTMVNKKGQTVCAIVRLKTRIDGHQASVTEDFQTLRETVVAKRREEKIEEWLKKKISQTYIRISPEWRNCDFRYEGWVK